MFNLYGTGVTVPMTTRILCFSIIALISLDACVTRATLLAQDPGPQRGVETNVSHRVDGTILINDRPFFPFGFYHISWANRGTTEQRQSDVKKLGSAGFNTVFTDLINDKDILHYNSFLNAAQTYGVYILTPMTNAMIPLISHQPSLLGVALADDANVNTTPDSIRQLNSVVKKLAPNKLTYISLFLALDRPEIPYFGLSDMVANQSYPIGNDNIEVVYQVMNSTVKSALSHNNVPIANLQTFAWQPNKPIPSPQELNNMTYQALMAGVKGVIYYAYRSKEIDLNKQPQTWNALERLAREVQTLSPVLLSGVRTELSDGQDERPLAVTFTGPAGNYFIALNTNRTQTRLVNIKLPDIKLRLRAVFGTRARLSAKDGVVQGQLSPLEVAIYKM